MCVTTLTLGLAFFAILGNFPIPAYSEFLKSSGLDNNVSGDAQCYHEYFKLIFIFYDCLCIEFGDKNHEFPVLQ